MTPENQTPVGGKPRSGPIRTLKVGDCVTVYGDIEIIAIQGRRVQVRVVKASAPPPTPVMLSTSRGNTGQ